MTPRWLGPIAGTVLLMPAPVILLGHGTLAASIPKTLSLQEVRRESLWRQSLPHTPFYQLSTVTDNLRAINNLSRSREISFVIDSSSRIAALTAYASAVSTPGNPRYHQFLTPSQLDRQFGPTPQMLSQSASALQAAGWRIISHQGLILNATIPSHLSNPEIPVSPSIWSATGFTAVHRTSNQSAPYQLAATSNIAPYNFREPPDFVSSKTESNGDQVMAVSWNPGFNSSLPAGLPWTLAISVENKSGVPLAISNVTNLTDTLSNVAAFSYSNAGYGSIFPGSQNQLWQLECEAFTDTPSGDTLSFDVVLTNGQSLPMAVVLPKFTGRSTALNPLTGTQLSNIVDSGSLINDAPASSRAPIAVYCEGQIPSASDMQTLMSSENLPMPQLQFQYFDGATSSMTNAADFGESELDVQAIASVDPGASITDFVYPANDPADTFVEMLSSLSQQTAIKIASVSYGFYGENPATVNAVVAACNAEGITIIDGSGDQGAWETGTDPGPVGVETNDGEAGIVTVGGLDLASAATFDASGNQIGVSGPAVAKAWGGDYLNGLPLLVAQQYTSPNAASTGGYGTNPIPNWQEGFLPSTATGIGVPDIASLAGTPGLLGILQGQDTSFGGTSLSAPLTAGWLSDLEGAIGVANDGMGNINPLLFGAAETAPEDFTQALWGSNGVYSVTSPASGSWNPVTGLGQPHWNALASLWASSQVSSLSLSSVQTTVIAGTPVTIDVKALNTAGAPVTTFSGGLNVIVTDSEATFPTTVNMVDGYASLAVDFATPGPQTITVTETEGTTSVEGSLTVMVSSPLIVDFSPNSPTAGTPLAITATAPLVRPTYQFWVYNPASQQWQSSGNYTSTQEYRFTPNVPGNYTVIVYGKSSSSSRWAYYTKTTINVGTAASKPMVSGLNVSEPQIDQPAGASVTFSAQATDPGGTPLYQFWVHGPNNQWVQSQNYSTSNQFTLSNLQPGSYVVAVNALDQSQVAAGDWHDVYYYSTVINVDSSISLSVPPESTLNSPVSVSAAAIGITNPVYQFWVQSPTGLWTQRGFGINSYSFTPTIPGTYVVAVYAKDPYALALPDYDVMTSQSITVP